VARYDPATFSPDVSVGYLSKRIYQLSLVRLDQAFEGENISYLQWAALASILDGRGATCKDLAHDLGHDRGATTRLIDTLEERQLALRERDPDDRRIVNLIITETGRALAERCMARVVDLWNGWLADWKPADVAQLIGYLQRLRLTLEKSQRPTAPVE
jgi:DNA-binding MarR family transcriptional regulator